MQNADVVRTLDEVADIMEILGENPYKARAYRQAARVIDTLPEPLWDIWRRGELEKVPGVGPRTLGRIHALLETGSLTEHDRLAARIPPGLLELLRLSGMGPKTVAAVWKTCGITTVDGLEQAILDGSLCAVPRMGPTRAQGLLKAIREHRERTGRTPLHRALAYAQAFVERLQKVPGVLRVEVAGSVRRRSETVGDLDLLVAADEPEAVMRAFAETPDAAEVLASGPTKSALKLRSGLRVDLRVVPITSFGAALHYFTGSKAHNVALRTRAVHLGLKINEYGVFDHDGRRLGGEDEEDIFRAVGLPWIPPELREGTGELEAAAQGRLPRLIEEEDLLGDLHVHTDASADAQSTLSEMAGEAARLGRAYLAITDHSRSRPLGLTADQLHDHADALWRENLARRGAPFILTGLEVDILPDGSLDLPLRDLAGLDCVVASVHSHFGMPRDEMTERIVRALRSGVVHILGHPSGRQIGTRPPFDYDLERVLAVAREMGVALEVNAMPDRLDLTDRACRMAKESGVKLVINSDAHNTSHLANLRYGVWVARRGWLEKEDVLNALPLEELRRYWRSRRLEAQEAPSSPAP